MVASGSHHGFAVLPDGDDLYDLLGGKFVVRNVPDLNHGAVVTELCGKRTGVSGNRARSPRSSEMLP